LHNAGLPDMYPKLVTIDPKAPEATIRRVTREK